MKTIATRLFFALLLLLCPAVAWAQDNCEPIPGLVDKVQKQLIDRGELDRALSTLREMSRDPDFQGCPDGMKLIRDKITYVEGLIRKRNANVSSYKTCPDGNHPHLIDLGLPSGTKWACCNVGAAKPEGDGDYYAWGETSTKSDYSWKTYKHCDGTAESCHNLGSSICGTQYDVAHVKWGGAWQMPTREQQDELRNTCKHEWTTVNGVSGRRFTGPNGGSIFLPAAGRRRGTGLDDHGSWGGYWSGTQSTSYGSYAYYLSFFSA